MNTWPPQIFWLRPEWFWALLPLALLLLALWWRQRHHSAWRGVIAPHLLPHLLRGRQTQPSPTPWLLLGLGWLLTVVALAGPAWERLPQPVLQRQQALVLILDLSHSMYAEDIAPSRLVRARHKLLTLLKQQREGVVGLVAYAGDAHVVAPLTDDRATLANLVPALSPEIMPVAGSDAGAAVRLAQQLLQRHDLEHGRLLLLTDGVSASAMEAVATTLKSGVQLSVLGIGTAEGGPVPQPEGYLKDADGDIVIASLPRPRLRELARRGGGEYRDIRLDDSELEELLASGPALSAPRREIAGGEMDRWRDRGPWLVLLVLPLAAAGFRRGWLLAPLILILLPAPQAQALEGRDWWQRPDQQGAELLRRGEPAAAAEAFEDPAWRATALYRAGDYAAAAEAFAALDSADAHYNRGNALARAGRLQEALEAYDQALEQAPGMEDARHNRARVQERLQEQQSPGDGQGQQPDGDQRGEGSESGSGNDGERNGDPTDGGDNTGDGTGQSGERRADAEPPGNDPGDPGSGRNGDSPTPGTSGSGDPDAAGDHQPQSDKPRGSAERNPETGAAADTGETPGGAQGAPPETGDSQTQPSASSTDGSEGGDDPATERWLRQIPDDPAGLLRRKFEYESRRREAEGDTAPREDGQRW